MTDEPKKEESQIHSVRPQATMTDEPKKKGSQIHFVRPQEKGCRPGTLLEDSFQESARIPIAGKPPGLFEFGHFTYGDPPGGDSKHAFEATRSHDSLGAVDTWHLAAKCPFAT